MNLEHVLAFGLGVLFAAIACWWVLVLDKLQRQGVSSAARGVVSLVAFLAILAGVVMLDLNSR